MAHDKLITIILDQGHWRQWQINEAVRAFKKGLVVAYPTDTIYGLGCRAGNIKAVRKIAKIKGRPAGKGFILLAADLRMVASYCRLSCFQRQTLRQLWPGRLTAILPARNGKLKQLAVGETLAMRVPDSAPLRRIIARVGEPITSTSLNRSGEKPLRNPKAIKKHFSVMPDIVFNAGTASRKKASTLVAFRADQLLVIRK